MGMKPIATIKRERGERDSRFLERAGEAARKVGGSVDTSDGMICPDCAPSGSHDGDTVGVVSIQYCYNCNYETRNEDGRYIAK